jgi:hypothetical protein
MSEQTTMTMKDAYNRGYEAAMNRIEGKQSLFMQGWNAAYEKHEKENPVEDTPDPYIQMLKSIDERLAKLEKYTQE